MAPLDATSCWARRLVSSGGASVTFKWWEEEPDTSRLLGITRDREFPFQSFIGLCKCKVCRGREKVLAQRIYSIFYYFNVCNVHWDQRWNLTFRAEVFSEMWMWKCLAPFQRSPTATASCLCWGRSCGDELASGHQAQNLWEIVNTDYLNITLQANYVHGTISLCTMYSTVICMYL